MKKILFILSLLINLQAENNVTATTNTVTDTKIYNVQVNGSSLGLEMAFSKKISASIRASFAPASTLLLLTSIQTEDTTTFGTELLVNYYFDSVFSDSYFVGIYSAYYASQGNGVYNSVTYDLTGDIFKLGVHWGYRWMWKNFNCALGVGYGVTTGDLLEKRITASASNGITERVFAPMFIATNIGWAF